MNRIILIGNLAKDPEISLRLKETIWNTNTECVCADSRPVASQ